MDDDAQAVVELETLIGQCDLARGGGRCNSQRRGAKACRQGTNGCEGKEGGKAYHKGSSLERHCKNRCPVLRNTWRNKYSQVIYIQIAGGIKETLAI